VEKACIRCDRYPSVPQHRQCSRPLVVVAQAHLWEAEPAIPLSDLLGIDYRAVGVSDMLRVSASANVAKPKTNRTNSRRTPRAWKPMGTGSRQPSNGMHNQSAGAQPTRGAISASTHASVTRWPFQDAFPIAVYEASSKRSQSGQSGCPVADRVAGR
jgi:hypothetical protein